MVNWKFSIIGAFLVVVLGFIGGMVAYGYYLSVIIAGIIVGYLVNNGYKNGAKNGLVAGFIGGLINGIYLYYHIFYNPGFLIGVVFSAFLGGVFNSILVAVGGVAGSLIKGKYIEKSGK